MTRETNNPILRRRFGERLSSLRKARGMSLKDLARRSRCDVRALGLYERGERYPLRARLFQFARVLQCEVRWLECLDDHPSPMPLTEMSSALDLMLAARAAAKRDRIHCPKYASTTSRHHQCQLWAYHDGECDPNLEAGDPRSSFAPDSESPPRGWKPGRERESRA